MIKEERVIIPNEVNIGATISFQDKLEKRPLVLLIMGTGSLDRDGNGLGFKSNIYKDLSDMFVEMGYVCIRYDKRGTHESKTKDLGFGLSDLVNDAEKIIKYAKKLDYVDENRAVVCGHSEGAMIATLLTKQEELNGVILLSGACIGLKEAMLYQNYLVLNQVKNMKGILGWFLRKKLKKEKIEKQVSELFDKAKQSNKKTFFYKGSIIPTKYMKEHEELTRESYIELLKAYKGHILAITGKKDVQADYHALETIQGKDNVTLYTPENVSHLLKKTEEEPNILEIQKQYKKTFKQPIHQGIKDKINDWSTKI